MLQPISQSQNSKLLSSPYIDAGVFKTFFRNAPDSERKGIIQLWLTEGTPFVFQNNPMLYDLVRQYVANRVGVNPKDVTLVGSARLGYSLAKNKWGRSFTPRESDLDFAIISNTLFTALVADFQAWVKDVREKRVLPGNEKQLQDWLASIDTTDRNIPNGYINIDFLFNKEKYPSIYKCNVAMWKINKMISLTKSAPVVKKCSLRVYSTWRSCVEQVLTNLKVALIW